MISYASFVRRTGKQSTKRVLLAVFAVLLLLSAALSLTETALLAGHDCPCTCGRLLGGGCTCGGSCHTCAVLSAVLLLLRTAFILSCALTAAYAVRTMLSGEAGLHISRRTRSLIWLKVKLSD